MGLTDVSLVLGFWHEGSQAPLILEGWGGGALLLPVSVGSVAVDRDGGKGVVLGGTTSCTFR